MGKEMGALPWSEIGIEAGRRLVSTSDETSFKMKEALAGVSGPGIPDFADHRWRYEFCILGMFWVWYVGNSPKVTTAGGAVPLLDAHHRACRQVLVEAGLLQNDADSLRVWENDLAEPFFCL